MIVRVSKDCPRTENLRSEFINKVESTLDNIGIPKYNRKYTLSHFDYDTVFWHVECTENQLTMLRLKDFTIYDSL